MKGTILLAAIIPSLAGCASGRSAPPLHLAASMGDVVGAESLIAAGEDVNTISDVSGNTYSRTALMVASREGHRDIVELLLANGANLHTEWFSDQTALGFASEEGHVEIVRLLLSNGAATPPEGQRGGETAVVLAAQEGHREIVELLLDNGANVNPEVYAENALMAAARQGRRDIAELVLSHGVSVNAASRTPNGMTALMFASRGGHREIVELLLSHGAEVDVRMGRTSFVRSGGRTISQSGGSTALMFAVQGGHQEIVDLLLSNGADVNVRNLSDETASRMALEQGDMAIIEALTVAEGLDYFERSLEALEGLIESNPTDADRLVVIIESRAVAEIQQQGAEDRFVWEGIQARGRSKGSVTLMNGSRGTALAFEFPGDRAPVSGLSPRAPMGDGSIQRFSGRVVLNQNAIFDGKGGKHNRLTFALIEGVGFVYVRGWGNVLVDGQQEQLGSPEVP